MGPEGAQTPLVLSNYGVAKQGTDRNIFLKNKYSLKSAFAGTPSHVIDETTMASRNINIIDNGNEPPSGT